MTRYRATLRLPGVRSLLLVVFLARLPMTAAGVTVILHVTTGLEHGFAAAGLVGSAITVGRSLGAPVMGWVVDRFGLRTMVAVTTTGESLFWLTAPAMSLPVLAVFGLIGGFVLLPVLCIGRQAMAALVPVEQRRTGYALDSILLDVTTVVGPILGVLACTRLGTENALTCLGIAVAAAGTLVFLVNPAVRADHEVAAERLPVRSWLTPRLLTVLAIGTAAMFVLAGMEVSIVASLSTHGAEDAAGLVLAVASAASMAGGLAHGGVRRSLSQVRLLVLLAVLCGCVGIAGTGVDLGASWWWLALALVPMATMCAPTLAATGERVAALAPVAVRGVATGLQSSAFTVGTAIGSPLIGLVVDHTAPAWGFAAAGAGGLLIAGTAIALLNRSSAATPAETASPVPSRAW
ncbi:putative MFS family arabinose efflux permease [Herbihabitans rhizosphaerae]|uniref:Putative MFS family arabinose efflux permease n=1 Tax=Herbihabitans rhizosphaerae TaxID=1872711 RepID=A0A4Q7L6H0_9PSEU|nr:MFS transporter [Herbihabitans rhizosphaerae]RZS44945.1 putative MFS family arabinose efflux permease [Herbihabitans rhizosphaerae]